MHRKSICLQRWTEFLFNFRNKIHLPATMFKIWTLHLILKSYNIPPPMIL